MTELKLERYTMRAGPACNHQTLDYALYSKAEAALAERDAEIVALRGLLEDCLDCIDENRPIAKAVKKVLEGKC